MAPTSEEMMMENTTGGDTLLSTVLDNRALALKYGMSYFYMQWDVMIFIILIFPMTFFGILGNLLIIAAVFKEKSLRTINNSFVVNLALANLLISGVVNPFNVIGVYEGEMWFLPRWKFLCDSITTVCSIGCGTALYNMGLIGLNRYFHIVKNDWYRKLYNTYTTIGLCIFAWIAPFMMQTFPLHMGFGGFAYEWKTFACTIDRMANYYYNLFVICIAFGIPIAFTGYFYLAIFLHVSASKKRISEMQGPGTKDGKSAMADKAQKESMRLARSVFIIFATFLLMYIPWSLIVVIDKYDNVWRPVYLFATLCVHGGTGANFLIYGMTNMQFKRAYITILGLDKCSTSMKAMLEDGSTTGTSSVATDATSVGNK